MYKGIDESFEECLRGGSLINLEDIDLDAVQRMGQLALTRMEAARVLEKRIPDNPLFCDVIFDLGYDSIHSLVSALMRLDGLKSENHKCLFAWLCFKRKDIEFDWNFFEKIRTWRNRMNYHGRAISVEDWNSVSLQMDLYFKALISDFRKKFDIASRK